MSWLRKSTVIYPGPEGIIGARIGSIRQKAVFYSSASDTPTSTDVQMRSLAKKVGTKAPVTLLWPRSSTTIKRVGAPRVSAEKLLSILRFELEGELPFPVGDALLAAVKCHSSAEAGVQDEVNVFAARRSDVEVVSKVASEMGFRIERVVPATVAVLLTLPKTQGVNLHLELRPRDSELLLTQEGQLLNSVWLGDLGSDNLVRQVQLWWEAEKQRADHEEATFTYRALGGEVPSELPLVLSKGFRQITELPAESMLVAGASAAHWPDIAAVDMAPPEITRSRLNRERLFRLATGGAIAAVAFSTLAFTTHLASNRLATKGEAMAAEWEDMQSVVQATLQQEQERDALLQEAEAWERELEGRIDWPLVLNQLSLAIPADVWLLEIRLEKGKEYRLSGRAESSDAAALFIEELRQAEVWADARLELSKTLSGTGNISFVVAGNLVVDTL